MFLLPKCKVNAENYSDHVASAWTQGSDIHVLKLMSEQFSATPFQLAY